jgi:asparagine synthase (glutamine-hydrolysing)
MPRRSRLRETCRWWSAGGLVLTADARIDNRQELIDALGPFPRAADAPDSELILRAYQAWGVRCPEHLVGDFAFALWDPARRHLFCARDQLGVKPFYYHHRPGRFFIFASEIKGMLTLPVVPRVLNEARVADYLQWSLDDQEITFYAGIVRLPPAHTLLVTPERLSLRRYWSLDPHREVRLASDDEYAEAFREIFSRAVRCRLRSASPVGSSLSGGLDSSSIVCTARSLLRQDGGSPLHTFSLTFDDLPECDERPFIDAVLDGGDLIPHLIRGDRLSPLEDLDEYLKYEDQASWVFNMCLHWAMHRSAAEQRRAVLLDGLGGDEVVCHGIGRLPELVRSGRLAGAGGFGDPAGPPLRAAADPDPEAAGHPAAPAAGRAQALGRQAGTTAARPATGPPPGGRCARGAHRSGRADPPPGPRAPRRSGTSRGSHSGRALAGINSAGFESIDPVAAAFSIEPRYPFYDRRLVEFCLALPGSRSSGGAGPVSSSDRPWPARSRSG